VKYYVRLGGRTLEVHVEGSRVAVDGVPAEAHCAAVPGTPLYHLLLAGESWTVAVQMLEGGAPGAAAGGGSRWALGAVGERIEAAVVDERTWQIQALTAKPPGPPTGGVVRAPMPGLVVRIEVEEGQRVDAGAGLVVVEAMKMENELRAPHGGVVTRIHVGVGEAVEKGAVLVTLASAEPSS